MSIFAGTKEVNAIKVGGTDVKAVYAGDEKVWPDLIEIPTAPNHTYAGRVIYSFRDSDLSGNTLTEYGGPIPGCNVTEGDIHLIIEAHKGGADPYANTFQFGYIGGTHGSFKTQQNDFSEYHKLSVGLCVAPANGVALNHFITDKATSANLPYDFLAYAWTFPKELFGNPDVAELRFKQASINDPIEILDGQPNAIALEVCGAMGVSTSTDYRGLTHKQRGTGTGKAYTLAGGYKYIRLDPNGQYFEASDPNVIGTGTAVRMYVYRKQ